MHTYHLLLVDDDQDTHLIYKSTLQSLHVTCDDAYDGNQAFELLKKNTYNLILLDLVMPDVNGIEFLDKVREQHLALPFVIVCSSMRERQIVVAAFQLGASDFLFKPFQPQQLRDTVQTYLDTLARSEADFTALKSGLEDEVAYLTKRDSATSTSGEGVSTSQGTFHFDSISKAISYMVCYRATGKLMVTSSRGTGELQYDNGRLQKVTFENKIGIDALESLKLLLHVDVVLVK